MKKIRLLFVAFGLLMAIVSSGTGLSFRMANPKIINYGAYGDYLSFDIQMQSTGTSSIWSGQAILSFDKTVIDPTTTNWSVSKTANGLAYGTFTVPAPPFDVFQKYNLTRSVTGNVANIAWTSNINEYPGVIGEAPGATFYNVVTTGWQAVATVTAKILNSDLGVSAISFVQLSMNGQQSYHSAPNVNTTYTPIGYDVDFTNTYVGRVYTATYGWTQVGGSTTDYTPVLNTSVWDGNATLPVSSLSNASAVRIHSGATLTVPPTGQLTVSGATEINTASGLILQSDVTNAGSLITATASGAGTTVVQRYMAAASWRIATSPVSGQSIQGFIGANANLATNTTPGNSDLRGMTDYVMATNTWSPFFNQTSAPGNVEVGKGYMLRAKTSGAGVVSFTGALNAGTTNVTLDNVSGTKWNCVGNPYTSAITNSGIFDANSGVFESGYVALYVFNGSTYDPINLATDATTHTQAGQGFFVKAATTSLQFPVGIKVHDNSAVLKSANSYPEIKLLALNDNKTVSTSIKFIAGTTEGLDEGYDAGIFKSDIGLNLYTRLVEDNGIDFILQCLPNNDFSRMIIPVGIDSKVGGEVTFSAEATNLSAECKIILEDKVNKTFTDLSKSVYTTTVAANSSISDRFRLHTSYQTTGLDMTGAFAGKLSAYAIRNTEIRVKGDVSKQAIATLYDIQGRVVLVKNLEEGSLNVIPTPNIKTGIYMLYVNDNQRIHRFKIPVTE